MIDKVSGRRSFLRLRAEGRHLRVGPLSCTMVLDPSLSGPQVGYALGRSFGSAVERNRLRRRLRVIVKGVGDRLPAGVYVFGASPRAKSASHEALMSAVDGLVNRCRAMDKAPNTVST